MDQNETLDDLSRIVSTFCQERDWDQFHGPKDLAIGLVTEASELLEQFRFLSEQECLACLEEPGRRESIDRQGLDVTAR